MAVLRFGKVHDTCLPFPLCLVGESREKARLCCCVLTEGPSGELPLIWCKVEAGEVMLPC